MYQDALSAQQGSLELRKQANVLNVQRELTKMNQEWDPAKLVQKEHLLVKAVVSPSENVYQFAVMVLTALQALFHVWSARGTRSVVCHQLTDLKNASIAQPTIIRSSQEHKTLDNVEKCAHLEHILILVLCLVHHAQ